MAGCLVVPSVVADPVGAATVTVDPSSITHRANKFYLGCHSDSGFTHQPRGFFAELIFGGSFEPLAPATSDAGSRDADGTSPQVAQLQSVKDTTKFLRHCDYQAFATQADDGNADFAFSVVPALNGAGPGTVSFQSTNFPTMYLTSNIPAGGGSEPGRLGIATNGTDPDSASFAQTDIVGSSDVAFYSLAKATFGQYIGLNGRLTGSCAGNYDKTCSDITLLSRAVAPADPPVEAQWTFAAAPKPRAPYDPWLQYADGTAAGTASRDATHPFNGQASASIAYSSGSGLLGWANRGLGNEGLFLEGGKEYQGYLFASSPAAVDITVQLQDYTTTPPSVLASSTLAFTGGNWTMLNFTLTPSVGTVCLDGSHDPSGVVQCGKMGPSAGHVCVKCGGQFVVGVNSPGAVVNIDFVSLQPGAWGRVGDLPVLQSGVDLLKSMGVSIIRQGGSFTDPDGYAWKNWRGLPWERPSMGWEWGASIVSGWGPFEFISMCEAAGIEPVITVSADSGACCSAEDMADLVE